MKSKLQRIEEAREEYKKEVSPYYKRYDETIYPFQYALGEAKGKAMKILEEATNSAYEKLQAKLKEIENEETND